MSANSFKASFVLMLAALACGSKVDSGGSSADPHPTQMVPNAGYVGTATPVVIAGTGFLVKTTQGAGGGQPTVDTTHRAWLGDTLDDAHALTSVTWVNDATTCGTATPPCLTATVPAGFATGAQPLTVENALGLRGRLDNAFTVVSTPLGALSATIAANRSTVSLGQAVTLTLTVTNTGNGAANVTAVTPSADPPTSATCGAVTPALPKAVASHASTDFTWTCTPSASGTLALNASVTGADSFTDLPLTATPTTPASVTAQTVPSLTAVIQAPGSVAFGSFFTVVMTVTNTGQAAANVVTPTTLSVSGTGQAAHISGPTPSSATVPGAVGTTNGSTSFSWTYQAGSSPGTLVFSGGASGVDANSGTTVEAPSVNSNQTTVAPLGASLALTPSSSFVSVNQTFTLTLTVTNGSSAAVDNLTPGTLSINPGGGAATYVSGPTPSSVASLAGCSTTPCANPPSQTFTWTYRATAAGALSPQVTNISGTDHISHQTVSANSNVLPLTVQTQSLLSVSTFTAAPTTVTVNQAVTVSMVVANAAGGAGANTVAVALTPGGVAATCSASGTPPTTIAAGSTGSFTWTCIPTAAGTLTFSAAVTWHDANSNTALSLGPVSATNSVTVQTAATLTATATPTTVSTGQAFTLTLTFTKTGTAQANVTGVTNPAGCTGPSATTITNVQTNQVITWSCTAPGTAGSMPLTSIVQWVDANIPGTTLNLTPTPASVTVVAAAGLSATATPTTVSTSQGFTLTLTFTKTGTAQANVTGVTSPSGCASPSATTITNVATGNQITWTCTAPGTAGSIPLTSIVQWVDANVPGTTLNLTPTPAAVTVVAAATLTATATPTTVSTGQAFTLTVTFTKGGTAQANVTGVTSPSGCASPSATTITNVATGNQITWTCTAPATAGSVSLTSIVQWVDVNIPATQNLTPTPASLTVQAAAGLSATATPTTVSTSQGFTLTLTFTKTGTAQANVTGVTSPSGCASPSATTITNVATGNQITWTCTAPGTAGSIPLTNIVQWVDVNIPATQNLTPAPTAVTVEAAAGLSATATPTTVSTSQGFTLTLTFTKTGTAQANVTGVTSPSGCASPSATTITNVATGNQITWTCTASATAGSVSLTSIVQWVDVNIPATQNLTPAPTAVTVEAAATLTATATPTTVSTGQAFTLTVTFTKGGTAQANVTGVTSPSGCASPSVTTITNVATGNQTTWTCTAPGTAGSIPLTNIVQWVDVNIPGTQNLTPTPASVTVQNHPVLTGSITASASAGTITLTVNNATVGAASASISGVTLTQSASGTCATAPSGFPFTIAAPSGSQVVTWSSCTGITVGGALEASVAATDANDGTNVSQTIGGGTASALMAGAVSEVTLVSTDPFGDGTPTAFVAAYQDLPWVGPSRDGSKLVRIDPTTDAVAVLPTSTVEAAAALLASSSVSGTSWLALGQPTDPAWTNRTSLPTSGQFPGDDAFPAAATFGTCGDGACVYLGRNVLGESGQPAAVPQLWRCIPSADAGRCAPGNWTLAAPNGSGDRLLSQLGQTTNGALSVLVATPRWLYVGFDNQSTGVQLYRVSVAPQAMGDFRGQSGCTAGSTGCQGLGGNGFGDSSLTRVFDAKVLTIGGAPSLWFTVGDGSGPVRVYRVDDVANAGLLTAVTTDTTPAQAAAQQGGGCSTGGGGLGLLAALVAPLLLRRWRRPSS